MRTIVVIRLADRSNCYPKGFKKDVLVPENELIFPADFSVLERKKEPMPAKLLLMLGHPFLTITGTRIDVLEETLTMDSTYSKQRGAQTVFFHAFTLMCSIHLCWIYLIQVWEMTRPCFLTRKFTTSFLSLSKKSRVKTNGDKHEIRADVPSRLSHYVWIMWMGYFILELWSLIFQLAKPIITETHFCSVPKYCSISPFDGSIII
jgi:hypothetical protein